jgi:hypothetical protein
MSTLFDTEEYSTASEDWTSDSWETPPEIASKMADLLRDDEYVILEPAAGRGNIVRHIPIGPLSAGQDRGVFAVELNPKRVAEGKLLAPKAVWQQGNFLSMQLQPEYDVVISNPPFSLAMDFLEHSLLWLYPENRNARLLYLLPGDFFASQERCDQFEALDCHIHHRYRIRGRVAYIKEGVQVEGRKIYDCVYDIRPGKIGATETVL